MSNIVAFSYFNATSAMPSLLVMSVVVDGKALMDTFRTAHSEAKRT